MEKLYSKSHEWVEMLDDTTAIVGISDYAQKMLGGIVFVGLPEVGDSVTVGESFADVESVKAVSDIYSPVTGIVAEINEELFDSPELINEDAGEAWFVKIEAISEIEELLDEKEYDEFCLSEGAE